MKLLSTKHWVITSYHLWINNKVENLNELLKSILIKILINKLTIL